MAPARLGCKLWVPSVRAGLGPCSAAVKEALLGAGGLRWLWMGKEPRAQGRTQPGQIWPHVHFDGSEEAVALPGEGL